MSRFAPRDEHILFFQYPSSEAEENVMECLV